MTDDKDKEKLPEKTTAKPQRKTRWQAFKDEWANAFSMKVADDQFNESDIELINNVARDIVKRKMAAPALLFLVSIQPVSFLMSQGMHMAKPFMPTVEEASKGRDFAEKFSLTTLITKPGAFDRFALLMECQEGIERLIDAIEKFEDERIEEERKKKKTRQHPE